MAFVTLVAKVFHPYLRCQPRAVQTSQFIRGLSSPRKIASKSWSDATNVSPEGNNGVVKFPTKAWKGCVQDSRKFRLLRENVLFKRYQTVVERLVEFPDKRKVSYDVLSHSSCGESVFVFPLNADKQSVTMLREYSPGQLDVLYGFPGGIVENGKHRSLEDAVRAELSEEASLQAGRVVNLTNGNGIAVGKYSTNNFNFFLGYDCAPDPHPKNQDFDEWIEVISDVPLAEVRKLLYEGALNTPHSLLACLALDYLSNRAPDEELQ